MARVRLGKTAMRCLKAIDDYGSLPLSHGHRYAAVSRAGCFVMQPTNHLLRAHGMVEWAGGNYDRWEVRLTDYGRDCLKRGSHNPAHVGSFSASYGPREDDRALLADGNAWYSDHQKEEMNQP